MRRCSTSPTALVTNTITTALNQEEAGLDERLGAMQGTFDLVLDPQSGRVLEDRSYEHGLDKEPEVATPEEQRVVDSIKG